MNDADSQLELEEREQAWLECCELADQAFTNERFDEAIQRWSETFELAKGFPEADPRYASSFSNLGLAQRLNGDVDSAEACYRQALTAWTDAAGWIERMQPTSYARSSVFHLRMERRHAQDYRRPALERYKIKLRAGLAATFNNLAEVLACHGQSEEAHALYSEALEVRLEAGLAEDPGLAVIDANLKQVGMENLTLTDVRPKLVSTLAVFRRQAERARWLVDRPPAFTDDGRLMVALLAARLVEHADLQPSHYSHPRNL